MVHNKNKFFAFSFLVILTICFTSCASIQNDTIIKTDNSELSFSIKNITYDFINFDSQYILEDDNSKSNQTKYKNILNSIDAALSIPSVNKELLSRLNAIKGLCFLFSNQIKDAEQCYKTAASYQATEEYTIILGTRLSASQEIALQKLTKYILENENGILLLEKALVEFDLSNFASAVSDFDRAFLLLSTNTITEEYKNVYSGIRELSWKLYKSAISSQNQDIIKKEMISELLTPNDMVQLTLSKSSLLNNNITYNNNTQFMEALAKEGYFSAAMDTKDQNKTSKELTESAIVSRILCARYLWNLFIKKTASQDMLIKYTIMYSKLINTQSPVLDVPLHSKDFDAVLGVVENEIINLIDGKNFNPNAYVTYSDFVIWLRNADKKAL